MSSNSSDIYALIRNKTESDRLNDQHRQHIENVGYVIHPKIMPHLPKDARIADVACGTGIWALDAAKLLSTETRLVGYDISSAQFPVESPENVTFITADAKQPFSSADHGTFDLVHVRALVAAMNPSDWAIVAKNLTQLLKPGGSIQWTEADLSGMRCLRDSTEYYHYTALPQLLTKFDGAIGARLSGSCNRLAEVFESYSSSMEVEVDVISTDKKTSLRRPVTSMYAVALYGWAEKAQIWSKDDLETMQERISVDINNGAYIRADVVTVIARNKIV